MCEEQATPSVVAVVLNWRDPLSTAGCVASLKDQRGLSKVIIVDNESSGELAVLSDDDVTVIEVAENRGFAGGMNIGLRKALESSADAVLAINNDSVLAPGALDALVAAWRRGGGRTGMVAPTIIYPDGTLQSVGGRLFPMTASTNDLAGAPFDYLTWACVLVPRETLEEVGLLDEDFFMYWEDVEYGLRTKDANRVLIVTAEAQLVHARSQSHRKAGAAIDAYSAFGLVTLARKRRGVLLIGATLRIGARTLRRAVGGSFEGVRAVISGAARAASRRPMTPYVTHGTRRSRQRRDE